MLSFKDAVRQSAFSVITDDGAISFYDAEGQTQAKISLYGDIILGRPTSVKSSQRVRPLWVLAKGDVLNRLWDRECIVHRLGGIEICKGLLQASFQASGSMRIAHRTQIHRGFHGTEYYVSPSGDFEFTHYAAGLRHCLHGPAHVLQSTYWDQCYKVKSDYYLYDQKLSEAVWAMAADVEIAREVARGKKSRLI